MQVKWTMVGSKGFMFEGNFDCNMVSEVSEELILEYDELPDILEDQETIDWTNITIEIKR